MEGIGLIPVRNEIETEQRKCRSIMKCTGSAVVLFALWNMLKCLMYFLLDTSVSRYLKESYSGDFERTFTIVVAMLIVLIDLYVRVYVGRGIVREADNPPEIRVTRSGKKKIKGRKRLNIALAYLILESVFGAANVFLNLDVVSTRFELVVSSVIDFTLTFIMIRMAVATYRIRRFREEG